MKKVFYGLAMALLVLAFSVPAAAADGVAIQVVNKTEKPLQAKVEIRSMEGTKNIDRVAGVGATIQFTKSETTHGDMKAPAGWMLYLHETCQILLYGEGDGAQCGSNYSECAYVEQLDACSFRATIAK
jgi:hypothetical protein